MIAVAVYKLLCSSRTLRNMLTFLYVQAAAAAAVASAAMSVSTDKLTAAAAAAAAESATAETASHVDVTTAADELCKIDSVGIYSQEHTRRSWCTCS
jgi:hypothetical protein